MNPADLKRLVRIGEGYHLEFKRKVSSPIRIAREAIALANTWGGAILIGVDDDGSIVGVKDAEEELFDLRKALEEHCDPPIPLQFETVPISRKREVIVATVEESDSKPHFLRTPEEPYRRQAFVRVDEQTLIASKEMEELLKQERSSEGVRFEFGDKELFLLRYLEEYGQIGVDAFSRIARIDREEASATLVVLTRARILRLVPSEKGDSFVLNQRQKRAARK